MMTEEQRGKEFPIHVDLGDDRPVIDLGSRAAALNLPKTGCMLVDYAQNKDGTLTVRTVCLQDAAEEEEPDDLEDALNRYGKTKRKEESDEEDED